MIFINEWLPNPNGTDTKGEFVELINTGSEPVSLSGWTMKATGKKIFKLGAQSIAAKGYLVLGRAETKLSLKNNGETISLYDAAGRIVDQSSYLGAAPSGESFSRVYYPAAGSNPDDAPQSFAWSVPTPGAANKINLYNGISASNYPIGVPLNVDTSFSGARGALTFAAALVCLSAILTVLVVYSLKSDENLSKLFFRGDSEVRT